MATLSQQSCVPCRGDSPPVTEAETAELMPSIPEWRVIEAEGTPQLQRVYRCKDFRQALTLTMQVGEAAEAEGHHPALLTEWGRVTVTWWTHAIGGLHRNDFIMAAKTDEIAKAVLQQ